MEVIKLGNSTAYNWCLKLAPALLVLVAAILYFDTTNALYSRWIKWDESLSHGLIIVGLFLFFLFSSSPLIIKKDSILISTLCLCALALSSLVWYASNLINLYIVEQLTLLAVIAFLLASVFGSSVLRQHFKLLALPIFAIPIWDQLTDPLVNLSGLVVGEMVRLIKLPAVIDSNSIFIPHGEIVIADGCSGLRYLTISLAIAYIISYLNDYSLKKLALSLSIAVFIGLAANWLRIFILVIVGYETQMKSSLMSDHEFFGWALFALILFPAIYFAPVVKRIPKNQLEQPLRPKLIPALIILLLGPTLHFFLTDEPSSQPINNRIPHNYTPVPENRMPIMLALVTTDKTENAVTTDQVYIQISHFQRKSQEEKLVPYIPRLYDHIAWSLLRQTHIYGGNFNVQIFRNKHNGIIVAQMQWFDVAGMRTSRYPIAKLLQIPAVITGENQFSITTLQRVCNKSDCVEEIDQLKAIKETLITET